MDANIEGRWPKGKEAGFKRAERVGYLLAGVCDLVAMLAVAPSSCPVGGVPGKSVPNSELNTGDAGTCFQILRDYWLWRKPLGFNGTLS